MFCFSRTFIVMRIAVLLVSTLGMAVVLCHARTQQRLPFLLQHHRYNNNVARGGGIVASSNNSPFLPQSPPGGDGDDDDNKNDDNVVYNGDSNVLYNNNGDNNNGGSGEIVEDDKDEPLHNNNDNNNWFSDPILEREERQTVQERVDAWRQQQQQLQQEQQQNEALLLNQPKNHNQFQNQQQQQQQHDPRLDEQGRMKLLTGATKTSRAIIFFVLMWRNVHLYEVADQTFHGILRLILVVPLMALFVANMAGVVTSITAASHHTNKRLKAILNLDKAIEVVLVFYYLLRLTLLPTVAVPREIYIANTLHSVFFILQCQAFTRLTWDDSFTTTHRPPPVAPPSHDNSSTDDLSPPPINPYPSYNTLGDTDRSETNSNNYL